MNTEEFESKYNSERFHDVLEYIYPSDLHQLTQSTALRLRFLMYSDAYLTNKPRIVFCGDVARTRVSNFPLLYGHRSMVPDGEVLQEMYTRMILFSDEEIASKQSPRLDWPGAFDLVYSK